MSEWRKSSRSANTADCVELAVGIDRTGVRDTKRPAGGSLALTPNAWRVFLGTVKAGRLDH